MAKIESNMVFVYMFKNHRDILFSDPELQAIYNEEERKYQERLKIKKEKERIRLLERHRAYQAYKMKVESPPSTDLLLSNDLNRLLILDCVDGGSSFINVILLDDNYDFVSEFPIARIEDHRIAMDFAYMLSDQFNCELQIFDGIGHNVNGNTCNVLQCEEDMEWISKKNCAF